MNKPILPFLELMTIRTCNLSCQGCTTFSDLKYSGYTTWEETSQFLGAWADRLDIQAIGFMGGEPLINPEIQDWILGIRKLLPNAQIRFVTNGLLLEKKWEIVELLQDIGNTVLKISNHTNSPEVQHVIERIFTTWNWKPVTEFGIKRWARPRRLRFQIATPVTFFKTFRGEYENMSPHNNLPSDAFELCVQKKCPLMYKGKIYKCGTLGLTPELLERFNWPNQPLWEPYIDTGLLPECSESSLLSFIGNFGKPHTKCSQCPGRKDTDSIINHQQTVTFKKLKYV
jgi:sulfatase maturation enzyme AslB (radical SAM superfamily)